VRYTLIGGHHGGRVVEFDGPAPVFVQVPYRVPADPFEFPLDPDEVTFGVETYELHVIDRPGPPTYIYVCARTSPAPSGLPE